MQTANFAIFLLIVAAAGLSAADPDPVKDFPADLNGTDFVLRKIDRPENINNQGSGGVIYGANSKTFPQLATQGVSTAYAVLKPGGEHLPHWHLRASEIVFLIQGKLQVDWVDTKGRLFEYTLNPGDTAIFPRGVAHSLRNVGDEESINISAFNSESPGTQVLSTTLFNFPIDVQVNAFQLPTAAVTAINSVGKAKGITPTTSPEEVSSNDGIGIGINLSADLRAGGDYRRAAGGRGL